MQKYATRCCQSVPEFPSCTEGLVAQICKEGQHFAQDQFVGSDFPCGAAVEYYFEEWLNRTEQLTDDECDAYLGEDKPYSPRQVLPSIQAACCSGQATSDRDMCPSGPSVCMDPSSFNPGQDIMSSGYCEGDEAVSESDCVFVDSSLWTGVDCDVTTSGADVNGQQAFCTQLGGTWKWNKCFEMQYVLGTMECFAPAKCEDAECLGARNWLAGECCTGGAASTPTCGNAGNATCTSVPKSITARARMQNLEPKRCR